MRAPRAITGAAGAYFAVAELSQLGWIASPKWGNAPRTDVLAQRVDGSRVASIQVKTRLSGPDFLLGNAIPVPTPEGGNEWFVRGPVLCVAAAAGLPDSIMCERLRRVNGTVLLTGGAHGIGLDAARRLHARGGRVVLADLDGEAAEREAAALGEGRALGLQVDVVDRAEVEGAVVAAVERFGGLDVVVANAGIEPEVRTVLSQHREQFDRVLAVNVGGVRHTVEAALPQIVTRRGHVVVIASIYAFINGAMAAPYAMSKAAVEAYGRALRVELAPHGATAGVAYFGFINTALVERSFAQRPVEILRQAMPAFITAPKPVGVAGEALVRGIECRSPTITAPGWVRPALRARGLLQLLDERFRRDARVHEAVRIAEAGAHAPTSTAATAAGP